MTEVLAGKRMLVVGASAGIGRSIALRAAKDGCEIAVVARRKDVLEDLTAKAATGTVIVADLGLPLHRMTTRLTSLDEVFLDRAGHGG